MKRRKKPFIILAVILIVVLLVAGYIKFFNGSLIYFTTGMKSGELIKTAGQKTPESRLMKHLPVTILCRLFQVRTPSGMEQRWRVWQQVAD